jgi:hypothetical protein
VSTLLLNAQEKAKALLTLGRWRLAFLSFSSLWMSWSGITNQLDMSLLSRWEWFQAIGGCLGNWTMLMAALFLVQGKAVAQGHAPGMEDVEEPEPPKPGVTPPTL